MLCLFRNSRIHPRLDKYAILASLLSVFAWLYFAFIEKALMTKLIEGKALIVDLVFGIPLVLALAVVVYALVYWTLKIIVIFLIPQAIVPANPDEGMVELSEEELAELENQHGEAYWKHQHREPLETESDEELKKDPKAANQQSSQNAKQRND